MYYICLEKKNSGLYYREFKTKEEAQKLKELLVFYNALLDRKPLKNIKIRSIPYNKSYGFFDRRLSDHSIEEISINFKYYIT